MRLPLCSKVLPNHFFVFRSLAAVLLLFSVRIAAEGSDAQPALWYWQHSYLSTDDALRSTEALMDRAQRAGYTGVVFWDSSFSFLSDSFWPKENTLRLKEALRYAADKHLKVIVTAAPFGFSNDALQANPNWAESERVVGSRFRVDARGRSLVPINTLQPLINGGFEAGERGWFNLHDQGTSIDASIAHSGNASAIVRYAKGNGRFRQMVELTPWRQYHFQVFYKTRAFQGLSQVEILDASGRQRFNPKVMLLNATFKAAETTDWQELDYSFNSRDATAAYVYFGVWGGSMGTIWFDDAALEETALVYVTRRPGTPVKVYDPDDPTMVYQEGVDYNYITDARMTSTRTPFTDSYHPPTPVTLPSTTHLKPGQIVAIDSYSVFPIPGINDVGMCLTEPGVLDWQRRNALAIKSMLPPGAGLLMQYDEMRQMNSCGSCRAKHMSAGQLLAWSVTQSAKLYHSVLPGVQLYAWNDMFDPYHNAVKHYYDVEGDLSGSWKGLPSDITVMNWNLGHLRTSLRWFSGEAIGQPTPHTQFIAGYYDSGNGATAATTELREAAGVPGINGLMYTTWRDDYSQLEAFADAARAHWGAYVESIAPGHSGGSVSRLLVIAPGLVLVAFVIGFCRRCWKR